MKKYKGEEFLNRLYKDLVHSNEVMHTAKGANKNEDLNIYLERLDRISKKASSKDKLDLLKYFYYKRYIIKEENIPENYFKMQEQIALERGYGHIEYGSFTRKKEINSIILEQKKSLDRWIEYFLSSDTNHYPMWFKYYVFQSIVKIGYFDKEKNKFTKRTDSTVKPFIEINREAIAMLYDELYKYLDKQEISDEALQQLIQNGNFNKIYSYMIRKLDKAKKSKSNSNEGIWKKYEQESDPNILFNDIHGKGTGWCTAGGLETAKSHLEDGDFYVYYTKDENGKYANPRIAIRMQWGSIAEIRGVAEQQNLENEMEDVLEGKLNEFPDKDEYKKKVSNMKELTKIYNKYKDWQDLTKEELRFLYEIDSKIIGFGYDDDPRVEEVIYHRNKRRDLSLVLDIAEDEISFTNEEAIKGNIKYHYGDLYFYNLINATGLVLPEKIRGNLILSSLMTTNGLVLPKEIGGDLDLRKLTTIKNYTFPNKINGSLYLNKLKKAENLVLPKEIYGSLQLDELTSADGITFPSFVKGNLDLRSLSTKQDLILPKEIGGYLDLNSLTNLDNFVLPKKVGSLNLKKITKVDGLICPEEVRYLNLSGLISAKGIVLPKKITGNSLNLNGLISAEGLKLPEEIDGDLCLNNLTNIDGLVLPRKIGGDLELKGLDKVQDLILPEEIDGDLVLKKLVYAKSLILPKVVNGTLNLESLISVKDLVIPAKIESLFDLSHIFSIKNLILPKNEEGEFYIPGNYIGTFSRKKLIKLAKRTEKRQNQKNKIKVKMLNRRKS